MLHATQAVTLYHRRYDEASRADVWERLVLYGASWYGGQGGTADSRDRSAADAYRVRIALRADAAPPVIEPGDILVRGAAAEAITGSTQATRLYAGRCFVVARVRINDRGPARLRHIYVEGR